MGDKVYRELVAFTSDVRNDPDHEARHSIRRFIRQLAHDLQHDHTMIERVEKFKGDVLDSTPVKVIPGHMWEATRSTLTTMARDPESILRTRLQDWTTDFAQRIEDEPEFRARLEQRIVGAASYLADNYAGEVTSIIGETVEQWDDEEASDRIELMVGKDLQFIRVNGTVVGSLAGLLIHAISDLIVAIAS